MLILFGVGLVVATAVLQENPGVLAMFCASLLLTIWARPLKKQQS
jgi:hypothetical protein